MQILQAVGKVVLVVFVVLLLGPLALCIVLFVIGENSTPHHFGNSYSSSPAPVYRASPRPSDKIFIGDAQKYAARGVVLEGESLAPTAHATSGAISRQSLIGWHGGAQLFWQLPRSGGAIAIPFRTAKSGRVALLLTHSYDYGIYGFTIDDHPIAAPVNLYSPRVLDNGLAVPDLILKPGSHVLRATNQGKAAASTGYQFGLDGIVLEPK